MNEDELLAEINLLKKFNDSQCVRLDALTRRVIELEKRIADK